MFSLLMSNDSETKHTTKPNQTKLNQKAQRNETKRNKAKQNETFETLQFLDLASPLPLP